jgi:hypothetical protein
MPALAPVLRLDEDEVGSGVCDGEDDAGEDEVGSGVCDGEDDVERALFVKVVDAVELIVLDGLKAASSTSGAGAAHVSSVGFWQSMRFSCVQPQHAHNLVSGL